MLSEHNKFLENAYMILNRVYFGDSLPEAVITIQSSQRAYGMAWAGSAPGPVSPRSWLEGIYDYASVGSPPVGDSHVLWRVVYPPVPPVGRHPQEHFVRIHDLHNNSNNTCAND